MILSGAGEGGRPAPRGAELARSLPIFITVVVVVVGVPRVAVLAAELLRDEDLEAWAGRNLESDAEREVRRCFSGASGEGELATRESWLSTSVSCISSGAMAAAVGGPLSEAIARAVGSSGFPAPLPCLIEDKLDIDENKTRPRSRERDQAS